MASGASIWMEEYISINGSVVGGVVYHNNTIYVATSENDKSNDIDQAWFDGENDDGVSDFNLNTHCIRYLEVTTIEDFGKSLPETNANKNLKNSRL